MYLHFIIQWRERMWSVKFPVLNTPNQHIHCNCKMTTTIISESAIPLHHLRSDHLRITDTYEAMENPVFYLSSVLVTVPKENKVLQGKSGEPKAGECRRRNCIVGWLWKQLSHCCTKRELFISAFHWSTMHFAYRFVHKGQRHIGFPWHFPFPQNQYQQSPGFALSVLLLSPRGLGQPGLQSSDSLLRNY